jgi:PKD repeat protein
VADAPVTFTIAATATAPATVRSVTVDFGDGTIQTFGNTTSVAHTYRSAGTYTVTVTVEDTNGSRSTSSTVVVVQGSDILVTLTASPSTLATGQVVTLTAALAQNPGNIPVQSVTFDFGDGNVRTVDSLTTSHIYGSSGNFLVSATVRLTNGRTAIGQAAVHVN